jgi:anti-sigma-K factor RskA
MYSHEETRDRLTDYVLGELGKPERARVEAHLAHCVDCAAEARELALAFQGIGLAEEPVQPPAHLRARVLGALAREERSRAAWPLRGSWAPWLAAAAALIAIVLGGLFARSAQREAQLARDLQRVRQDLARASANAEAVGAQADRAVAILTAPDLRRIDLEGFDASRTATARAYWSSTQGLLIVADRLPLPPAGRVYQVWLIGSQSTAPVSAGLMERPATGRGMLIVSPPSGVAGSGVTVAVTDEPPGGLSAPTGSKHFVGSI